jgi:hypothetical protein
MAKSMRIGMSSCPPPNDLVLEVIFAENLVEHDLYVMAGMPAAGVIKTAPLFEDTG